MRSKLSVARVARNMSSAVEPGECMSPAAWPCTEAPCNVGVSRVESFRPDMAILVPVAVCDGCVELVCISFLQGIGKSHMALVNYDTLQYKR